jgi:hypothetical protein
MLMNHLLQLIYWFIDSLSLYFFFSFYNYFYRGFYFILSININQKLYIFPLFWEKKNLINYKFFIIQTVFLKSSISFNLKIANFTFPCIKRIEITH